ncbi:methyl-accepting chemotaxis protein [Jiella sp. MQZ9-1]|uniref:PAS domain S-box protein n=1 Tax=Jiella flava TaxID=2816857 RepID=A0A939FZ57_9HYPH|nr:methyl-accepting chemotaxis protein [Jiella flava]MBO0662024.1 PAS domain S-box protein [Jiella flava]MCD2470649.1 methyl-accepting chemotaxis protein [Jiella flava]
MSIPFLRNIHASQRLAALDALHTNVMVADAKLNITYLNPELTQFLREAEADVKRELPRFDVDKLIGSNIDIFHKNPSHQRHMLASLQQTHRATITVGTRSFDLVVTPLRDGNITTGFVVEWADAKERLLNVDYAGQIAAVHRSQAVIEFKIDGTIVSANDNFLKVMGYSLSEVVGKHHSIFVEPAMRESSEYRQFWEALRAGRFQASEYRRFGKNGRELWIQGSYNPILDANGKVMKVVKYATDVTARVNAVGELGAALSDLAGGKLGRRIEQPLPPEIDQLRIDFNQAVNGLEDAMQQVKSATATIGDGMNEINTAAADLSQRTEQQAASLEETVASLSEITKAVNDTASDANKANQATATALHDAENGGTVVSKAVAAMNEIEASSQQINQIIGVIDEIAFQTNLLALNAGVEAARAGEAGKGFAVVAQEVRALAQRSAEAAKEIKGLITTSSRQVESGVQLARASGKSLEEIVSRVQEVSALVSEIARSAKQQAGTLREVSTAADQMDKVTQQNAAMVEETTAAARNLSVETEGLANLMQRFEVTGGGHTPRRSAARPAGKAAVSLAAPAKATPAKAAAAQPRTAGNNALKAAHAEDSWEAF